MFRGLKTLWEKQNRSFEKDANIHWASLSRITNLLIIMNITLFFLTELVTKQGYYYTFYSIFFLCLVHIGTLLPLGLLKRLWYYLIFLILEGVGIYFLAASTWYWIITNR